MSCRRPPEDPDDSPESLESDDEVEYFVLVEELVCVSTAVPKSEQLEHSSNSAPSTFVVVSEDSFAPHISH